MFSIWFFVWLFLSAALIYFLVWTVFILMRQKRTWRAFAVKNKLRYRSGTTFAAPDVSGMLNGYTISIFTSEHMAKNARTTRKLTAIEIQISSAMPFAGGVASGDMVEVVRGLNFKEEYKPQNPGWKDSFIISTDARYAMQDFLTPTRFDALLPLMNINNSWMIFVFKNDMTLLRIDTPDPLDKYDRLESLVSKMIVAAKALELNVGEDTRLKAAAAKKSAGGIPHKLAEPVSMPSLQLEDEPVKTPIIQNPPEEEPQA